MKLIFLLQFVFIFLFNVNLKAQLGEIPMDTVDFESVCDYIAIDTSAQNIWQIGIPNKIVFNSANSLPNAIVTDTINNYPINNHSYFDLYLGNFNNTWYPYSMFFEFKHKIDSDTLKDGGYITVSYDMGQTWVNIINDSLFWGNSPQFSISTLYSNTDTLFNHEKGFSGTTNGWESVNFGWFVPPTKKSGNTIPGDTMIIRFNFISDSIDTQKEGWLIDDIRLYAVDMGGKIGSKDNLKTISVFPNPSSDKMIISLDKSYKDVKFEIYNSLGVCVEKLNYQYTKEIDFKNSNLMNGIYFGRIIFNDERMEDFKFEVVR